MKKYIVCAATIIMALVGFTGCSSDDGLADVTGKDSTAPEIYHVSLSINTATRALLTPTGSGDNVWLDAKWEKGDQITVYHYTNGKADDTPLTLTADAEGDIVTFSGEESAAKGKWKVGDYIVATFPKSGDKLTLKNDNGTLSGSFSLSDQDGTLETIRNKYNLETASGTVTRVSADGDVRVHLTTEKFRSMVAIVRYAFYVKGNNGSYTRLTNYRSLRVSNLILNFNIFKGGNGAAPNLYYLDKPDAYSGHRRGVVTFNGSSLGNIDYMPYVVFPLDDPDVKSKDENGKPTSYPEHYAAPIFTLTKGGRTYFGQIGGKVNGYPSDNEGSQYQAGRYYQVNVLLKRQ